MFRRFVFSPYQMPITDYNIRRHNKNVVRTKSIFKRKMTLKVYRNVRTEKNTHNLCSLWGIHVVRSIFLSPFSFRSSQLAIPLILKYKEVGVSKSG
jgi:hypothetical protein